MGAQAFYDYYSERWKERWPSLAEALAGEHAYTTLTPASDRPPYYLDPASVAVASLLPLPETDDTTRRAQVVDLCAAPGGKTLVLAIRMGALLAEGRARLTANERSAARRARLVSVVNVHLVPELRAAVSVTGHDAARWGLHHPDEYDAVLADVPCSSERHLLAVPKELARWSPSRTRRLAVQQFAILAAAIDSTRPGGSILYSTCALSEAENDRVVERALKRRQGRVIHVPAEELARRIAGKTESNEAIRDAAPVPSVRFQLIAEPTEFGIRILPDRSGGAGPMYCALLTRV